MKTIKWESNPTACLLWRSQWEPSSLSFFFVFLYFFYEGLEMRWLINFFTMSIVKIFSVHLHKSFLHVKNRKDKWLQSWPLYVCTGEVVAFPIDQNKVRSKPRRLGWDRLTRAIFVRLGKGDTKDWPAILVSLLLQ